MINDHTNQSSEGSISYDEQDCSFFTKHAKLQIEARIALAQAKEIAHIQIEVSS